MVAYCSSSEMCYFIINCKMKKCYYSIVQYVICASFFTGAMFYTVGSELFSTDSVNGVYSKALKRCKNDSEVRNMLTFRFNLIIDIV